MRPFAALLWTLVIIESASTKSQVVKTSGQKILKKGRIADCEAANGFPRFLGHI